jgi:alpha-ribazole phosphatase
MSESTSIVETRWWWVRHAPVPDGGRIYGQRDLDCDCSNEKVFRAVAARLPANAVWVTSALKRAKQTAAAIKRQTCTRRHARACRFQRTAPR